MADETQPSEAGGEPPQKTAKQLAKEAAKQAKLEKFKQKKDKKEAAPAKEPSEVHLTYKRTYCNR